jgi:putative glutamine amidotransferase
VASNVSKPLIGITTYCEPASWGVWHSEAALLPTTYLDAVVAAGGAPILLPPVLDPEVAASTVDAVVLAGGADIDPARYRQQPHPRTGRPQAWRDGFEIELLSAAGERGLPVLGICRGLEVLTVARGGTLRQHLPDLLGHGHHQPAPATFGTTAVCTATGTRTAAILGERTEVRCYHHQGVDTVGEGMVATAWASDGAVEAVELTGERFVVGVQWHPEEDRGDIRLFEALVAAARERRTEGRTT